MKTELAIQNAQIVMVEVPDDWVQCSVNYDWYPSESFMREGKIVRTNCKDAYEMPYEEMVAMEKQSKEIWKDRAKTSVYHAHQKILQKQYFISSAKANSVTKQELIKALEALPDDARIVITQEGHYADGKFVDVYAPIPLMYDDNVKFEDMDGGFPCFSIGHSAQNY